MHRATGNLLGLLRSGRVPAIVDDFGRAFTYLRISVTDLCNLRCVYCMPEDGVSALPRSDILSFEEIVTLVEAAAACGVNKIRLTGGEPLVRKGLFRLIRMLASIRGIDDIALTTNGVLLAEQAGALASAGLRRVNVSLDTLDPSRFRRIARRGELNDVLRGIEAIEALGLAPLKINMVVLRGVNDDEVEAFAALSINRPLQIRFIEVMPFSESRDCTTRMSSCDYVSGEVIRERIEKRFGKLIPVEIGRDMSAPAQVYTLPGAIGNLGFISAMSSAFCARCNRLRLTADGKLRACLLEGGELNVLSILRSNLNPSTIRARLARLIAAYQTSAQQKPEFHSVWDKFAPGAMSRIGG
jgi:GTP 3',8-cyclase